MIAFGIALRRDEQPALGAVEKPLGHAAGRNGAEGGVVGGAEHDQVGFSPLRQRLQGIGG